MAEPKRFDLRPADPTDAPAIAAVNVAAGRIGWAPFLPRARLQSFDPSVARWEERLTAAGSRDAWLATEGDEVVGFVVTRPCRGDRTEGELTGLYTDPRVWGAGVGRSLMAKALDVLAASGCREAVLWTEERNRRPRALYARAGWRPDGATREREFLGTPIRELRYRIALAGGEAG